MKKRMLRSKRVTATLPARTNSDVAFKEWLDTYLPKAFSKQDGTWDTFERCIANASRRISERIRFGNS